MKRVMKKIIQLAAFVAMLAILLFLIIAGAKAQGSVPGRMERTGIESYGPVGVDGSVVIKNLVLQEIGDSLLLAFNVEVNRRAINNRQSWRIVPRLNGDFDETVQEFPILLVTGRQKERHFKRKERFGNEWLSANFPDYKATIPKGTDTILNYRVTLPYEYWMDNSRLSLDQYLASPREKRQLFSSDGYRRVALEPYEPYAVRPLVNYISPEREVKRRSEVFQALVDFPVNVSRIIPGYRRNTEELAQIDKKVKNIKDNPCMEIESVYMEGYASPEGGVELNRRLATERVLALKDYFVRIHGIPPGVIRTDAVTEDWDGLRAIVENWEDGPDKERIMAVIDGPEPPEAKETRLRALPHQWVRLVSEAFPLLRRTECTIHFRVSDFSLEQSRSLISTYPELFSHSELYTLAMSNREGMDERLHILETILRFYPDDDTALNNYAAALVAAGETTTARRYLERISDTKVAANNLGLVCLLEGRYEEAGKYFELSDTDESVHNQLELERKIEADAKMKRYCSR